MWTIGSPKTSGRIGQGTLAFGITIPDAVSIQRGTTRQSHELVALQGIKPDSMTTGTPIDGNFPENNGLHLMLTSRALHGMGVYWPNSGWQGRNPLK